MRWQGCLALAAILSSCASVPPPEPPLHPLPPPGELEKRLPPGPTLDPIPPDITRYADRRVGPEQCQGLPRGILVSPAGYAEIALALAERNRLRLETKALRTLRAEDWIAATELERKAVERVAELEGRVAGERRWAPWRFWGGFAAGAAGVLVVGWASSRATR